MKKSMKAALSILSAMAMLGGNALTASAGSLTAEELFEKYTTEFPVYYSEDVQGYGIMARSLDHANSHYYDENGSSLDDLPAIPSDIPVCFYDNPYRYRVRNTERSILEYTYTCDCENGLYYAVLDNGTAIIAGADTDWINENSPEKLVIPEEIGGYKVTEIAQRAFSGWSGFNVFCPSLREVEIADTVEVIHPYAFENVFGSGSSRKGCKINIPANVKIICRRAFANNYEAMGEEYSGDTDNRYRAKRMITLPESLEYVQNDAFKNDNERYIFKMPKSLVLTDTTVIGGSETIEFSTLPQYTVGYWNTYYLDGEFNVVTFTDAIRYQKEKQNEEYQIAYETLREERADESGDVDVSGNVDVCDAVLLSRFCAEDSEAVISDEGKALADVNGDGNIDLNDTTAILQKIAKLS